MPYALGAILLIGLLIYVLNNKRLKTAVVQGLSEDSTSIPQA